jgi:transcriptional/translational regulatory protein YebC/TACO1
MPGFQTGGKTEMKTETTTTYTLTPEDIESAIRKSLGLNGSDSVTYKFERTPDGGHKIVSATLTTRDQPRMMARAAG